MVFQTPHLLWLLLWVPAFAVVLIIAARRRSRALSALYRDRGLPRRATIGRHAQAVFICLAVACVALALARPGWNPKMEPLSREARDVIFLLDVSRSMLAEDRRPNRLENAKALIATCVDQLDPGQRVGLILFGGSASIRSPLTRDHLFLLDALAEASPDDVDHGGTRIGDALLKIGEKLLSENMQGFQDIILITDGGDQDSSPAVAIDKLNELGASVMVIGIGSGPPGVRIPQLTPGGEAGFVIHEGKEVWTHLRADLLKEMVASAHSGLFLEAGTRSLDLADVYSKFAAHLGTQEVMVEAVEQYDEGFPVFVGASILFLFLGIISRQYSPWQRRPKPA
ncbi:MAG: Ca-activated chloride channel family protein [Rhodothermales bacterium]|jgi:Ca-activated chloride channel family protein